jgi:hypothetical protein
MRSAGRIAARVDLFGANIVSSDEMRSDQYRQDDRGPHCNGLLQGDMELIDKGL